MIKYFHGAGKRGPYFEGWYLKHQTKEGSALALIPAIHIDRTGRHSASLQVIADNQVWWLEYPETEFDASEQAFRIQMGKNLFTSQRIWLDMEQNGLSLCGTLCYGQFTPLKSDIMGPFRFLPGMECSHGVISMGICWKEHWR